MLYSWVVGILAVSQQSLSHVTSQSCVCSNHNAHMSSISKSWSASRVGLLLLDVCIRNELWEECGWEHAASCGQGSESWRMTSN